MIPTVLVVPGEHRSPPFCNTRHFSPSGNPGNDGERQKYFTLDKKVCITTTVQEDDNDRPTALVSSLALHGTKCRWDVHDHEHIQIHVDSHILF